MRPRLSPFTLLHLLFAIGFGIAITLSAAAADDRSNSRFARIILFVPEESDPPTDYEEKLSSVAIRTENFFKHGIEQWGWKVKRSQIFARNSDNEIDIITARGFLQPDVKGHDALPTMTNFALDAGLKHIGKRASDETIWWTFYYCPDHDVRGFRGMGGRDGGRAINAYPAADGHITPIIHLAEQSMWALNLKGSIHEFGHALGLSHLGPKLSTQLGNTLMGPINRAFKNKSQLKHDEPRVYLSEASATMLARHPIFDTQPPQKAPIYEIQSQIEISEDSENSIHIQGSAKSPVKIHSVVLFDSDRGFGNYWSRSYRATIDENGSFTIIANEPFPAPNGNLALFYCLEDGRNSGTGKKGVLSKDVISFSYEGLPGSRVFTRD